MIHSQFREDFAMTDKTDTTDDVKKKDEPTMGKAWGHLKGALPSVTTVLESGESMIKNLKALEDAGDTYGVSNARLMMSEAEFDKIIEPVLKKAGDSAARYKAKFTEYRNTVNALHARAQRYKALLAEETRLIAEAKAAQGQIQRIRALVSNQRNPDLGAYKSYLEGLYTDLKTQILDVLYEEHRAISLETLNETPFPATSDQSIAQLKVTHARLSSRVIDAQKNYSARPPQTYTAELVWTREDYPEMFSALEQRHRILLAVDANDESVRKVFGSRQNINVTRCKVILPGATTTSGGVQVSITHSGESRFRDHRNVWHYFSHAPLHMEFEQKYDANGVPIQEVGGGQIMAGAYISVSPFTVWSIKMPSEDGLNHGLSLKGVTSLKMVLDYTAKAKVYAL